MSERWSSWSRARGAPPLIYGHRGVRGLLPENTMAAFERAHAEGADGIELDVRTAKTGEVVVLHDTDLKRVTNGADERAVADVSWSELRRMDVGQGEKPPLLTDVLAFARARRMRVNVELKHDASDRVRLVREVARTLSTIPNADRFVMVSSFDPAILMGFRAITSGLLSAFLFHEGQRHRRPWWVARALPADALHPERTLITRAEIEAAHRRGKIVNGWTVNDPDEARDLAEAGIDGLITDTPRLIADAVG